MKTKLSGSGNILSFGFGWLLLTTAVLSLSANEVSATVRLPDCAVILHVTEPGRPVPGQNVPVHPSDSIIALGKDQVKALVLTLANRGATESLDVSFEPLGAVQVTAGGGTRQAAVKTGEFGTLNFSVKGLDAGTVCGSRSRGVRVVAQKGSGAARKVCGISETYFHCPAP